MELYITGVAVAFCLIAFGLGYNRGYKDGWLDGYHGRSRIYDKRKMPMEED